MWDNQTREGRCNRLKQHMLSSSRILWQQCFIAQLRHTEEIFKRNKQFSLLKKEAERVWKTTTADVCMIPAETLIPVRLLGTLSHFTSSALGLSQLFQAGLDGLDSMAVLPLSAVHPSHFSGSLAQKSPPLHADMPVFACAVHICKYLAAASHPLLTPFLGSTLMWWFPRDQEAPPHMQNVPLNESILE